MSKTLVNSGINMDKLSTTWLAGFLPPVSPCSILPLGTKTRWWQFYLQPETCRKGMFPNWTCAHPFQMGWNETTQRRQNHNLPCLALKPRKNKKPQVFVGRTPRLHCHQLCTPFQGWTPGVGSWWSCNFNGCSKYLCIHLGWSDMFEIGIFKLYFHIKSKVFMVYYFIISSTFWNFRHRLVRHYWYHTDFWNCLKTMFILSVDRTMIWSIGQQKAKPYSLKS